MDFILQASNQGSLEFVFSPSGNNGEYLLSSDEQHRSSSTLEFKGVGLLTFCASKLSVSIFSEHQVFVYKEKCGNLLISSSLELLLSCKKSRTTPNINYFIEYIACGATPRVHTPFLDVFYLPPGSVLSSSDMHVDLGEELDPREIEVLETLEDGLRKRLAGVRTVMLEYSGGLESSILLHSLLEVMPDGDLQLIHLTDFASGQVDDLQRVKSLAAKHRCDLTILDVEDLKPFQVTTCSNIKPNFPHPGLVNIGYLDYSSHLLSSQSTAIFNGAGGDSIFCAAPQKGLPVELLKKGDVIGAFKSSLCISNYLRSPFIHAIKESFEEYRCMQMKLDDPGRFFANSNGINKVVASGHCAREFKVDIPAHPHCREVSTLERHLNSAVNRYEMQSSPMAAFAGRYICPFLAPDILSTGLATPSDQLLKYGIDRYSIRKRAADKYQSDEFWYRRKGGVAGLTQRCFLHYKSEIKSFITEGYLVRADIVNVDGMCRLIDEVAAGVVKCPGSLINLFTANIYINHWKGYVDEF
ncbi:asparagine synthase-related protein [Pseudomonas sp. D3-10]|uniref:asparagine synthase-related protein n=1 Tax=Pseudomonas sp. D3-10 TaxID=2817392 RepID=UPI003DA7B0A2